MRRPLFFLASSLQPFHFAQLGTPLNFHWTYLLLYFTVIFVCLPFKTFLSMKYGARGDPCPTVASTWYRPAFCFRYSWRVSRGVSSIIGQTWWVCSRQGTWYEAATCLALFQTHILQLMTSSRPSISRRRRAFKEGVFSLRRYVK